MTALPTGIVTFLFTDIEGSSRLWERDRPAMQRAVARHDALLAEAIASHGGVLFKHVGDMVQAAFQRPLDGVLAAAEAQRALASEPWPETGPIRARMGVHLGEAAPDARGDYNQIACLNRLSRLMSAGHGGQVLLSEAVRTATANRLPEGITLRELGRHRLRDLLESEMVAQLVIAGLPADFPPLKSLEGHPTNLPTLPTPLLGREAELAEVTALLAGAGPRLVTLVGPGGVGKTHLAQQSGADLLDRFPDGVWFVPLGEVIDPEMIVPAIAAAVGVREGGGLTMREALVHWIATKRVLFVIDNMEQVVAGAATLAALLAECPDMRFLATSRQRLGIGGERVFPVQPLPLNTDRSGESAGMSPAEQLFVERARAVAPGLTIDDRTGPTIAAICARLDGLPLAIELAAAQLRTRTLAELLADLESRFELLVGGRREALRHQHSLEATIAWSYERLDPDSQRLMRLLSTFAGGWSREAVGAIASDLDNAIARLGELVEQSLVRRETVADDVSRWSMLESIRAFGRACLHEAAEGPLADQRHADWCLTFVQVASERLDGAEQEAWLARLDLEQANSRAALRWCTGDGNAGQGLELATALVPYWQIRGHLSEGRRWLALAMKRAGATAAAVAGAGGLAQAQGDYDSARTLYRDALALAREGGDRDREAMLLINLGSLAIEQGEMDEAERLCVEGLSLASATDGQRHRADALANLGAIAHYRGDTERALRHYMDCLTVWRGKGDSQGVADMLLNVLLLLGPNPNERERAQAAGEESLRRFRSLGDRQGEALALSGLGMVAALAGEQDRAAMLHQESLSLARCIEDQNTEARALGSLAGVALDREQVDEASNLLTTMLQLDAVRGDADFTAFGLEMMAAVNAERGNDERAARLHGAAAAIRKEIDVPIHPESRARHEAVTSLLSDRLGERFAGLAAAGATLTADDAVAEAMSRGPATPATSLAASLQTLDDLLAR